ncbi:hypothetical protein V2J09_006764 [Rumex salicifolius]
MATSPTESGQDSGSRHHAYSRKQKSLGLLCTNFLGLYNRPGIESIGLDDAASKLGVERRRIYDIVNVLESVGVLARKAKNQYSWKGFQGIPKALEDLKAQGLRDGDEDEGPNTGNENSNPIGSQQSTNTCSQPDSSSSKNDNRREKSLGLLTQNFVKLFICSDNQAELISLDDAAKLLLGDGHNSSIMRTKVRRLYDIANVLSSMYLIEKTHHSETRKPAFRWLGLTKMLETDFSSPPAIAFDVKRRAFGTDITNVSSKRTKVDVPFVKEPKEEISFQVKIEKPDDSYYTGNAGQDIKQSSRSIHFGPFSPANAVATPERKSTIHFKDLEDLASTYRPQYQNQAVKELFDHYVEAWKSWIFENLVLDTDVKRLVGKDDATAHNDFIFYMNIFP